MAEKKEVAQKQEFTTGLSNWTNTINLFHIIFFLLLS